MSVTRADAKKRIVIPDAEPGDVFDIQHLGDERFVLARLQQPDAIAGMSVEACMQAMERLPLRMKVSWEQLRDLTREP